jgi:hypothetical protein
VVQPEARGETGATMEGMVGEKKFYPNVVSGFVQDMRMLSVVLRQESPAVSQRPALSTADSMA